MADNQSSPQQNPGVDTNTFTKGITKDYNETFVSDGLYTHARNAVNNSHDGQMGVIGNEPSNLKCIDLPYTLIGSTYLIADDWLVFTTDDIDSEIGIFNEANCTYTKVVNDRCLGFKRSHLITATSRVRYDCGTMAYWDDGLNPTRSMNLDDVPWIHIDTYPNDCLVRTYPTYPNGDKMLDCEKIRIAPFIKHPCISLTKGANAGTLPNGSYQVCIAYTIDELKVTDYIGLSEVQGLFSHDNLASSLQVTITGIDTRFDEFELVVLANVNAQTTAKRIGFYNTSQGRIFIDRWDVEYVNIPVGQVVLRTEPVEKSDALYPVGDYILRTGVYSKFRFNYQPLANQIRTKWVAVQYPADYYLKGNNHTGYMRDEQYSFFIRWVYNTGEFSDSYHIPGRPPLPSDTVNISGNDVFETTIMQTWQVQNTASVTPSPSPLPIRSDGGVEVARGNMGYWESTERYPSDKRDIWDSFPLISGDPLNLCGKAIRHHKMPDETVQGMPGIFSNNGDNIILLGVEFENIKCPVDQNGNAIQSVVGYEILRGSREGSKSIIGKGLINNMRTYDIPGNTSKGMFQNYPYNDLPNRSGRNTGGETGYDEYMTTKFTDGENGSSNGDNDINADKMGGYRQDVFSFHSPEVTFSNPFLNPYAFKAYAEYTGTSTGRFEVPYKHPKFKFPSNFVNVIVDIIAVVKTASDIYFAVTNTEHAANFSWNLAASDDLNVTQNLFTDHRNDELYYHQKELEIRGEAIGGGGGSLQAQVYGSFGSWTNLNGGEISTPKKAEGYGNNHGGNNAADAENPDRTAQEVQKRSKSNTAIGVTNALMMLATVLVRELSLQEQLYRLVLGLIPYRQYAVQYNSHAFYNQFKPVVINNRRREIIKSYYVGQGIQQYDLNYLINNIFRSKFVVFGLGATLPDPTTIDNSRVIKSRTGVGLDTDFNRTVASFYGSMKLAIATQYGQLESIKQLPITTCIFDINPATPNVVYSTPYTLFGGDIYIGRFTEKNTMFFFNNWLMGELDGALDIDYTRYVNVPTPRFWVNTTNKNGQIWKIASNYRSMDDVTHGTWFIKDGSFYLFNSGVRDFFVESEINIADRDWEEDIARRHYDTYRYGDLTSMFRSDVIKSGNYYKYDYNLSVTKLFNSHISWGNLLPRDYNPNIYSTCYTYRPNRVIYSLPQQDAAKKDAWRIYLPNNYKDFISPVSSIKSVNKTGSVFMMKNLSPLQFMGVEELKLDGTGAKITIGDGKLFESGQNQLQSLVNTDDSFEYASNQSKFSAINTVFGLFFVSQSNGKIFNYAGQGLNDISKNGMKWWFAKNLPSQLTAQFTTYALYDNPIVGVGVQVMFDATHEILYVTKKDYKPNYPAATPLDKLDKIELDSDNVTFKFNGTTIQLTDTTYFEDASWTSSYDPKLNAWLSFHDWKPTAMLAGKAHFMSVAKASSTTAKDTIWKHNIRCDSYCNFYGVDYPFEIEFVSSTGQTVNSMRSIEYLLEAYRYHNNCRDKFHVLDENFDQAIIYNSEQVSGLLKLNIKGKNDPLGMLAYPKINAPLGYIDIQFSKEENKYRFNQFWDITNNRGEYNPVNIPMFNTSANGYIYPINPQYVNYNKAVLERKKFRHNVSRVFLRRLKSDNNKLLFKISNQKFLQSPR